MHLLQDFLIFCVIKVMLKVKCEPAFIQLFSVSGIPIKQCFPSFIVCWHSKKDKQISRHNSRMNLFILFASSITGDSEKDDDLFFGDHHYSGNDLQRSCNVARKHGHLQKKSHYL